MKDGIGNEILKDDLLHVNLESENVIARVMEVSEGTVLDQNTRKIRAGSIRIMIDLTLKCPWPELPIQFLPQAYKIYDPIKQKKAEASADAILDKVVGEEGSNKAITEMPSRFLKRPSDIKDEKLNPTK